MTGGRQLSNASSLTLRAMSLGIASAAHIDKGGIPHQSTFPAFNTDFIRRLITTARREVAAGEVYVEFPSDTSMVGGAFRIAGLVPTGIPGGNPRFSETQSRKWGQRGNLDTPDGNGDLSSGFLVL